MKRHLDSYDYERRYVGNLTKDLAIINYEKGVKIAKKLDLDYNQAETFNKIVTDFVPSIPFIDKSSILRFGLELGRMKASVTQ